MWFVYLGALRRSRFAFFFWFPLTATAGIGTLAWLWAGLMLLGSARQVGGGDPESGGFALLGAALFFGYFLICPISFAVSIWLRPTKEAYKAVFIIPTLAVYMLILANFSAVASYLENQSLVVTVLDTQSRPLDNVVISYETTDQHNGFAIPLSSLKGSVHTDPNGQALLMVPKSQQISCELMKPGFARSSFRMDRVWGFGIHQSWVTGGMLDVPDGKIMHVTLYMGFPDEKLPYPPYNPTWVPKNK